ncbi:hypothetical protein LCGC14_1058810 [marine sediment metagenome]|uniref:Uncharacterized protein n=1 Tax=marine sediment metagenome TaxID=412755 RepID=A0A0F9N8M1_9ZZZZ
MADHYEMRLLCDAFYDWSTLGNHAVNTWWRPTPAAAFGELESDERAEVIYAEIWSPVSLTGDEALKKVVIVADGQELGKYISLCGVRSAVMAPPKDRLWGSKLYSFGTPLDITQAVQNPVANTTIKVKQNLTVATLAGPASGVPPESPITTDYRIRLWGRVYNVNELPRFGQMGFPAYLTERTRNRTIILKKDAIAITGETWLTLPGGKDQQIPKINPFARYAQNLLATDGMQGDYQFRLQTGGVVDEQENMYWEFDELDALFVEGLGIKTGAIPYLATNIARTGLRIDGSYHPKGPTTRLSMFSTTVGINELNFGHLAPMAPVSHPYYAAIPKLPQPYLIWNEIGYPVIRDDGVGAVALAIPNNTIIAMTGKRIEMRG